MVDEKNFFLHAKKLENGEISSHDFLILVNERDSARFSNIETLFEQFVQDYSDYLWHTPAIIFKKANRYDLLIKTKRKIPSDDFFECVNQFNVHDMDIDFIANNFNLYFLTKHINIDKINAMRNILRFNRYQNFLCVYDTEFFISCMDCGEMYDFNKLINFKAQPHFNNPYFLPRELNFIIRNKDHVFPICETNYEPWKDEIPNHFILKVFGVNIEEKVFYKMQKTNKEILNQIYELSKTFPVVNSDELVEELNLNLKSGNINQMEYENIMSTIPVKQSKSRAVRVI